MNNFEDVNIEDLIPQRPPVIMIDAVSEFFGTGIQCSFKIKKANVFEENNLLSEAGLIENMAQTAAALNGLRCRLEKRKVPVGFIGSVSELKINFLPAAGSTIETTVRETANIMNASIIKAEVCHAGKKAAECEMKIFLMED